MGHFITSALINAQNEAAFDQLLGAAVVRDFSLFNR